RRSACAADATGSCLSDRRQLSQLRGSGRAEDPGVHQEVPAEVSSAAGSQVPADPATTGTPRCSVPDGESASDFRGDSAAAARPAAGKAEYQWEVLALPEQ